MMGYGFVYVLRNEYLPGIYKIGMTRRDPGQRCVEVSSATGVPDAFEIVCCGNVRNPYQFEREVHEAFSNCRVSRRREFFRLHDFYAMEVGLMIQDRALRDTGQFFDGGLDEIARRHRKNQMDAEADYFSRCNWLDKRADVIAKGCPQ